MKNLRVAARYAKSLVDLAQDQKKLEAIKDDMEQLQSLLSNRDFYMLLKSPVVNPTKKQQILEAILGKAEVDELTMAFAKILVVKGRESNLPEIADAFLKSYKEIMHITTVKVTSATKLSDAQVNEIQAKLLADDSTDQAVEIETVVNPDLIGGFVLEYDGKVYDASVQHKLKELRKEFSQQNVYVSQVSR